MNWTRREFLQKAGIGTCFLLAARSGILSAAALDEIEAAIARGEESWVASVCQLCPGACGIRVRKFGDWPVSIAGNPLHPVNRGGLCPKGIAGILSFYDPDRIRSPLQRAGPRGAGQWREITWDEALAAVTRSLAGLREKKQSHRVAVLGGRYRGSMRTLFERFLMAYGSPHYIDNDFAAWQGPVEALEKTHGLHAAPTYALDKARYLLSFSAPLLEAAASPVENLRGWAAMRRGDPSHRGRVVHVGTHLSVTAAKADEWIPINPGSEGLFAMGILYIMLRENLYDGLYLGAHSQGFSHFKSHVLDNYSPEMVSEATGVGIDTIIRLAREFAASRPALAVCGRLPPRDQVAVHTLNALAGSINVPGGVLIGREAVLHDLPPVETDEIAAVGMTREKVRLWGGDSPPVEILFFYYTNPLYSNVQPDSIREEFAKIPLLVSFSPFMDETTEFCDLILPDHHYLERWQDVPASTMEGFPLVGLAQPVRPPLYATRPTGDVLLQIARALGGTVARSCPWDSYHAFLREGFKKLYESGKGDLFGTAFEASWTSLLSRGGWWSPSYHDYEEFEKGLGDKGGWWDPNYSYDEWAGIFATGEGKFEFSTELPFLAPQLSGQYPLFLEVMPLMAMTGGRNAGQAWLADIAGPQVQMGWNSWAQINPETAKTLHIEEGDEIWVESAVGRIRVTAKLYEGIHPMVVGIPIGFGHTAMGRWAKGIGANVRRIQERDDRATAGIPSERMTRVKIVKL